MKKYILTLSIMASLSLNSLAETNNVDNYKAISKNIMSSYNINDAKKFANDFNAKLSNNLSENQIKAVIEGLQSQFGQIQNLSEPKFISENTYSFLVDLENGKINLVLKFDPQNKLAGILFKPLDSLVYPKINKDTSINDIIKPYMDEKSNVGLAVGIIDNNDQKNLVYGKNDKDKKTLIDNQTIFEIGSISKVFTNIVLADMSLNKELNLNDPIVKYLPKSKKALEFKNRKINF
ncbi:MAG: serine hydrolase, partial [Candidatus Sericytochromatia bacterium]|nr:serine hydrolase [Candidatus Sericytochromatia bacterium]